MVYFQINGEKFQTSFDEMTKMLIDKSDGKFIDSSVLSSFNLSFPDDDREGFAKLHDFLLEYNDGIYNKLTANHRDLSKTYVKFPSYFEENKKKAFIHINERKQLFEQVNTFLSNHDFFEADEAMAAKIISVLYAIYDHHLGFELQDLTMNVETIFQISSTFDTKFIEKFVELFKLTMHNNDSSFVWNSLVRDYNAVQENQETSKYILKEIEVYSPQTDRSVCKELVSYFKTMNERLGYDRITSLFPMLKIFHWCDELRIFEYVNDFLALLNVYSEYSNHKSVNSRKFINKLTGDTYNIGALNDAIKFLGTAYFMDCINLTNASKLNKMFLNDNYYIDMKKLQKFKKFVAPGSDSYLILVYLVFRQNEHFYKLALDKYQNDVLQKTSTKEDKTVDIVDRRTMLLNDLAVTDQDRDILKSFSTKRLETLKYYLDINLIDRNFVTKFIKQLQDKSMFRLFKQNISLFNKSTSSIVKYNGSILFSDPLLLARRWQLYTEIYKLPIDNLTNYEFLLNGDVFDIIDAFISLGYFDVILRYPMYLSVDSKLLLKRLKIAQTDPQIKILNEDLTFTDQLLSGVNFPISDNELDEYIGEDFPVLHTDDIQQLCLTNK